MITKINSWKPDVTIRLYLNCKGVHASFLDLLESGYENLGFVAMVHMADQKIKCSEHSELVSLWPMGQVPAVLHMASDLLREAKFQDHLDLYTVCWLTLAEQFSKSDFLIQVNFVMIWGLVLGFQRETHFSQTLDCQQVFDFKLLLLALFLLKVPCLRVQVLYFLLSVQLSFCS